MQKRVVSTSITAYSVSEMLLLICMTFAISFILGQSLPSVSAGATASSISGSFDSSGLFHQSNAGAWTLNTATGVATGPVNSIKVVNSGGNWVSTGQVVSSSATPSPLLTGSQAVGGVSAAGAIVNGNTATSIPGIGEVTGIKAITNNGVTSYDITLKNGDVLTKQASSLTAQQQSAISAMGVPGTTANAYSYNTFGGFVKGNNFFYGNLFQGLQYALVAAGIVYGVASLFGADSQTAKSLTASVGAGVLGAKIAVGLWGKSTGQAGGQGVLIGKDGIFSNVFGKEGLTGTGAFVIGTVIAAAVFIATYKKQSQQLVTFQCLPWEPQLGGQNCEQCNKDPMRPCTEYRCKSLGQACELLNPGTNHEACTWVNPKDVNSPTIREWTEALKPTSLIYTPNNALRPSARGVTIKSSTDDGCLPAFTPLQFGVLTNEPAQCKVDWNSTTSFEDMQYYFGGSNYYEYNHSQIMRLPSPNSADSDLTPLLQNDGTFALFVRCRDANNNTNVDAYSINFCVQAGPDTTPPIVEGTSIVSGSPVQAGADNTPIQVYVNEPATCKWSGQDKSYDDMENAMSCATDASQINANLQYTCSGNLTGINDQQNNTYYFRCKDQPSAQDSDRNVMRQSYVLSLQGTQPLAIISVGPNSTVIGSTTTVPVDLTVETGFGANTGVATCRFSQTGIAGSYVDMYNTNAAFHKQSLNLGAGNYTYYIRCVDAGGNLVDSNATFSVAVDTVAPTVTRVYKQDNTLQVVTDEDSQCVYSQTSCTYDFKDGLPMSFANPDSQQIHITPWKTNMPYYIKCRDSYGNEPNPNTCSIIATGLNLGVQAKTTGASS